MRINRLEEPELLWLSVYVEPQFKFNLFGLLESFVMNDKAIIVTAVLTLVLAVMCLAGVVIGNKTLAQIGSTFMISQAILAGRVMIGR